MWNFDLLSKPDAHRNVESIVQVLQGHSNVIDCIAWAPIEAAKTIQLADFNLVVSTGGEITVSGTGDMGTPASG